MSDIFYLCKCSLNHVLFASEGCTCVSLFYDVLNVSFWDPWKSCSRRGSCQVWFLSITRPERLQNFIIRTHMVATSRLCLSELWCPTFSNCGIVNLIMFFMHRKFVHVSVFQWCFKWFFSGTLGGHVSVVGPVKFGFEEPHELSTSKASS